MNAEGRLSDRTDAVGPPSTQAALVPPRLPPYDRSRGLPPGQREISVLPGYGAHLSDRLPTLDAAPAITVMGDAGASRSLALAVASSWITTWRETHG
jgi:hypothetical protein